MLRVKVRLKSKKGAVETTALINSGYGSEVPEIAIPRSLAKRLGLSPYRGAIKEGYYSAGGRISAYRIPRSIEVAVLAEERETEPVTADAIIMAKIDEVLVSDRLSDDLGIDPIKLGEGTWRFIDEPERVRKGVPPQLWR